MPRPSQEGGVYDAGCAMVKNAASADSDSVGSVSEKRDPAKPVGWLIGLELLRKLKSIAVYGAFGNQMDHKDWMTPTLFWFQAPGEVPPSPPLPPAILHTIPIAQPDLWFDYIADTGDGQTAMHNVACLCLSDADIDSATVDNSVTLRPPGSEGKPGTRRLPRGAFLLVGGDTAYHVADVPTLTERFQQPFEWAGKDLLDRGWPAPEPRPLLGIPGNHDYYDALHGFNQQFREELPRPDPIGPFGKGVNPPPPRLTLPSFRRLQQSSYFAVRLPFDWRLWALDNQDGHLDIRQQQFFRGMHPVDGPPQRLIVATPEPVIALGAPIKEDSALSDTFIALGLPPTFLDLEHPPAQGKHRLSPNCARLDLAGDLHHYERYGASEIRPQYAAVVAGTGGAFLHPTHTRAGGAMPDRQDPATRDSRTMIVSRLLNPINIWAGGFVWLAGALISGVLMVGVAVDDSLRRFLGWLLGSLPVDHLRPTTGYLGSIAAAMDLPALTQLPPSIVAVATMALLSALLILGFSRLGLTIRKRSERRAQYPFVTKCALGVALAVLAAFRWIAAAAFPVIPVAEAPAYLPFVVNANVVLSLLVVPALVTWTAQYRLVRAEVHQSWAVGKQRKRRDPLGTLALWAGTAVAIVVVLVVHFRFARLPGVVLLSDGLLLAVILTCLVGLPLLGLFANERLPWTRRMSLLALGLIQAIGHLGVPFLIVAFGAWQAGLVWAGMYGVLAAVACFLAKSGIRSPVVVLWVGWIALPILMVVVGPHSAEPLGVVRLLFACCVGAVGSCLVLGSYLWTATLFGGHCNEAGGGARLERHRQILRFHVGREGLEVFVLGIDRPTMPKHEGDPCGAIRLVDHFTLPSQGGVSS